MSQPADAQRPEPAPAPPDAAAQPLVLCVDDDPWTLKMVSMILAHLPVTCLTSRKPQEAVELACRLKPYLLILDLVMPQMNGWETLEKIRAACPDAAPRVLILTAKDNNLERLMAANIARVDMFLTKPFDATELLQAVARLIK